MRRLTVENLKKGFEFNLENGLPATAQSMNSTQVLATVNKVQPRDYWPTLSDDTLSFLIVKVPVEGEMVRLIYHALMEEALRTTVRQLHFNLKQELRYADYIIYEDTVYLWYDRTAEYLRGAVKQRVSPRVAALVLTLPERNTKWHFGKPADE
jgi:hypothetical protein